MQTLKAWTITQLKASMIKDLQDCQTDTERGICKAICEKEIREFADSLTRKLTPCERAIAEECGWVG